MLPKKWFMALLWFYSTCARSESLSQSPKRCWKSLAPIKGGVRQEHNVVAWGDTVYILCGLRKNVSEETTAAVEAYNTRTNTWTELTPAPVPLHHANVAVVDGKIYILGGIKGPIFGGVPTGLSFQYDIASNKWKEISPMPYGLGSAAIGVHKKKIYLAGGIQPRGNVSGNRFGMNVIDVVASYDTTTDKWMTHPELSLPEGRDHSGGIVVDGIFYVVGGRVGSHLNNRKTVYALNLTSSDRIWVEMAPLPFARGGIAAAAAIGRIYVFGGEGNPNNLNGTFSEVGIFDIAQNRSEAGSPMPYPRHGFGAVAINDIIYLPGGGLKMGGGGLSDVNDAYVPC
jgi:N-acetylneuraminic acid mutarotase